MTITTPTQEVKPFYRAYDKGSTEGALQDCLGAGYRALPLPEIADKRIEGKEPWNQWRTTISPRMTGRPTGETEAVTIYWHGPTEFVTPQGIREAKVQGLVNGAGRVDQEIFDAIYAIAAAQKPHLIIPHRKLLKLTSGPISIANAEKDLRVIASLDGQERTGEYLPAHARAYNTRQIGVRHSNDLDKESPLWRLLYLGGNDNYGLCGDSLDGNGRFSGVRDASAEGAPKEKTEMEAQARVPPTLSDILQVTIDLVPQFAQAELNERLKKLYE